LGTSQLIVDNSVCRIRLDRIGEAAVAGRTGPDGAGWRDQHVRFSAVLFR
jgi:hypothetical protein